MTIVTEKREYNRSFVIEENEDGYMSFLGHEADSEKMNWIEGRKLWGEIICPDTIQPAVSRKFLEDSSIKETYSLKNTSSFPVFLQKTDIGIYTTFNDNYEGAEECLEKRCHTHIFCGKEAAYVMALKMSGRGPHLGLKLLKGSIGSYSVEREPALGSNDRGDFILHPEIGKLEPGEIAIIQWELFWFETREGFLQKLLSTPGFPVAFPRQTTYFRGETMLFEIAVRGVVDFSNTYIVNGGCRIPFKTVQKDGITWISGELAAEKDGEYQIDVSISGKKTFLLLYCCPELDTVIEKRCRFIVEKQQFHDKKSPLNGAYLIYDNEEKRMFYSHLDDHNGGRERIAMGALMALWLKNHPDKKLEDSLDEYERYVYRELYHRGSGIVYNDIQHNLDWNRLYNYPWMATFQLELYYLKGKREYLKDAFHVMSRYYEDRGTEFYGIGVPAAELKKELLNAGMQKEAQCISDSAEKHAEKIVKNGIHYPASEVAYEQSIVAPAVSCLLQGYEITGRQDFLEEAERQMKVLSLFNGAQPDYHLFENAVRHWDGYWFGKYRRYGDTFPHYWSVLTGVEYIRYGQLTGNTKYNEKAAASLRGCLNLFFEDGSASCAMVFPEQVNGEKANYYDPWANDQDWALYYALKYQDLVEMRIEK